MRRFLLASAAGLAAMMVVATAEAGCSVSGFAATFDQAKTSGYGTSGTVCGVPLTISQSYTHSQLEGLTTLSGTIYGVPFTVTSNSPFSTWGSGSSINMTINGRTVTISTSGSSFNATPSGGSGNTDTFTIKVNGSTIASGTKTSLTIQDGINLLSALGVYDSYAAVQQTVARSEARATTTLTSNRISTVLAAALSPITKGPMRERGRDPGRDSAPSGPGRDNSRDGARSQTGISSGDSMSVDGRGLWISPANSWLSSDDPLARFSGMLQNVMTGIDYTLTPNVVAGLAIGFENSNIHTSFNEGGVSTQAMSFTPYLGLALLDRLLTLDFMGSYAYYDGIQKRQVVGLSKVKGKFTGQRWMMASNLSGNFKVAEKVTLTPVVGGMVAWDHRFRFTESDGTRPLKNDSAVVEGKLGIKGTYSFERADVYLGTTFMRDFIQDQDITNPDQKTGRNEVLLAIGTNWIIDDNQTLGIEASNSFARLYTHQTTIQANYRYSF